MRGLQHGLLQGQTRQHFRWVSVLDRVTCRFVDQAGAGVLVSLHVHHIAPGTDRATRQVDLILAVVQVGNGRGHRVFQKTLRGRVALCRRVERRTQLADGVEYVLGLVCIDRDIKLVTRIEHARRSAATQGKVDTGRCRHASHHNPRGYRRAAAGQRTGVQIEGPGTGELQDRPAFREKAAVISGVAHRCIAHDNRRYVARRTVADEAVRLGRQFETVSGDETIDVGGVIAGLGDDVQFERHAAEVDVRAALGIWVEHPSASRLGGSVGAGGIGDHELSAAGELQLVRLAAAEVGIEGRTGVHQAWRQLDASVIDGRREHGGRTASGVDRLLENVPAGIVQAQRHRVTDFQLQLSLVTLIAVGAVTVTHKRLSVVAGAGEDVLAVGVLAVHQVQQLLFGLLEFCGNGFAVIVVQRTATSTYRQLADFLQYVVDAVQHTLFLRLSRVQRVDVGGVLTQHGFLLFKLQ
ncbi:hypothetical protein D3C80_746360 [compost metagenome]